MRKRFLIPLLVLGSVFFDNAVHAQQIDSMMGVYADRLPPEKIHIHFDKSVYNKGETVWYKVYIMQGRDTAAASTNVYLEWYDAGGKLITHTVAPVVLSTSPGSFDIPADYKGESLHVKAFTRWMLNDDPAFSYQRELLINKSIVKTAKPAPTKTTVTIFPESGFLVQGLHTRVAFKATNKFGNPVFIRGVLVDNTNNTLDSLYVQHDGMGSFYLTPSPGRTYQLNWIDESGGAGSTPVPVTKTEGAQLTITRTKDKAWFQVDRTAHVPDNFKRMTMLVHMNRVGLYQVAINTSDKTTLSSEIPVNDLPTGLLQFTLFTSDWIPVAERVIFINNGSHEFDVKLTAPLINVEKRGKNSLELFVPDTLFTNMSLAITDAAVSPPDQHTIFSDILLSSEIKGKVYNPAYYLSDDTDSIAAHLDLVMLTNGWRRFDWDKIKAGIAPKIEYAIETGYMKLEGKVSKVKKNSKPMQLNLVILDKDSSRQFISVPIEKDGSFVYPIVFFDTAKLFYSLNNNKLLTEKSGLQINNGLLQLTPKNIQPVGTELHVWNEVSAKQKLNELLVEQELLRKKMLETTLKEVTVTAKIKTREEVLNEKYATGFFRGGPTKKDYILDLTDPHKPTSARNVIEYLQGKIPGLSVRGDVLEWRGGGPTLFLNEMRVDLGTIKDVPLLQVAMIKAFPPLFMFSAGGGGGGAIVVYTKLGNDYVPPAEVNGLSSMHLAGYSKFREFYNPSYEQPEDSFTKRDNRTTLYWNPNLITNKIQQRIPIDFFNNDFTKTFNVVLEGINTTGKMMRVVRRIDANTKPD